MPVAGRQGDTQVQDPFVGSECLSGRALVNTQVGITCIVQFVAKFQVDIFEESGPQRALDAGIPSSELETLIVRVTEQAVLHMGNDGADARLAQQIDL